MVDSRSAGLIGGIAGGINFRSGDTSGTAAKTADDRASQGTEYFRLESEEENSRKENYTDRSMELRASLNSLALINAAYLLRCSRNKAIISDDENPAELLKHKKIEKIGADKQDKEDNKE